MSNGGYGGGRQQFPQQSQRFGGNMGAPGSFGNGPNGYGGGYNPYGMQGGGITKGPMALGQPMQGGDMAMGNAMRQMPDGSFRGVGLGAGNPTQFMSNDPYGPQGPGMEGTQQQGAPWRSMNKPMQMMEKQPYSLGNIGYQPPQRDAMNPYQQGGGMNKPMALGPDPTLNRFPQVSSPPNDFMTNGYQGGNGLGIDPTLNRFRPISGPPNDFMTNGYQGQMPQTSGLHPYQPQQPPAPTFQRPQTGAPTLPPSGGMQTAVGTVRDPVTGEWSNPAGSQAKGFQAAGGQNIFGPGGGIAGGTAPGEQWRTMQNEYAQQRATQMALPAPFGRYPDGTPINDPNQNFRANANQGRYGGGWGQ